MLTLEAKISLLVRIGQLITSQDEEWRIAKDHAERLNAWFTQEHIQSAADNIAQVFLQKAQLEAWISAYELPVTKARTVGIIMAGNIPLVGFHDFLCVFVSGHKAQIKLSSKDKILLQFIVDKMIAWDARVADYVQFSDMLKDCDAYIATGSNNSARYFEQYFAKYPSIIRRNRTSVAVLTGKESDADLEALGKDIFEYFGLGCRNVSQLWVPRGYAFSRLLESLSSYKHLIDFHKYKNNYDYYLAVYLLNNVACYTNDVVLMVENPVPFSGVSVLHYQYYDDEAACITQLQQDNDVQCVVGAAAGLIPFGESQKPQLSQYADGADVLAFLQGL